MINRDNFISELILREHVRRRILTKHQQRVVTESKFRNLIRDLLSEAEQGEAPAESTGINVLADLLKKIVPVLEDEYRMLTSSPEQRTSFRAHIIQAVKNSLAPIVATNAEETNENLEYEIDFSLLSEKITIDVGDDEAEEVEGEFIDIEDTGEEEDTFGIKDQNFFSRFSWPSGPKSDPQRSDLYCSSSLFSAGTKRQKFSAPDATQLKLARKPPRTQKKAAPRGTVGEGEPYRQHRRPYNTR